MVFDIGLEILIAASDETSPFDDVFGLSVEAPPLDRDAWEEEVSKRDDVMSVEALQTEYAEYLSQEIKNIQNAITDLIAYIYENDLESIPGVKEFLYALSHEEKLIEKDGVWILEDSGGLYERLSRGKWMLDHYDFYTKQLTYLIPDDKKIEWVQKVDTMSPEEVLTTAYWPVSQRVSISLPELSEKKPLAS